MKTRNSEFTLLGFTQLARSIYLQDPQSSPGSDLAAPERSSPISPTLFSIPRDRATRPLSGNRHTMPPDLVIITSWTSAASKYIAKYITSYNALYPGVPILVITTLVSNLVIRSTSRKIEVLGPAVEYLLSRESSPAAAASPTILPYTYFNQRRRYEDPLSKVRFSSILLHAFSEGGAHKAVCLAHAYLKSTNHTSHLPIAALILDSTPGRPRPKNLTIGLRQALPHSTSNPLIRALRTALSAGVVWLVWAALQLRRYISGDKEQDFISQTRKALNDERLWGDLRNVPRTYLFGEEDKIIKWSDVHSHGVESAMVLGEGSVGSLMVKFKKTRHCAHCVGNRIAYWEAVRITWEARQDRGLGFNLGLSRWLSLDSLCYLGDTEYRPDRG